MRGVDRRFGSVDSDRDRSGCLVGVASNRTGRLVRRCATLVAMAAALPPLTWSSVLDSWRWDSASAVLIVLLSLAYGWAYRRRTADDVVQRWRPWCFGVGVGLWGVAAFSVVGVYADVLFWMRV